MAVNKHGRENYYRPTKKELDVIKISDIEYTEKDFDKWYNENFSDKKYELIYPWIIGFHACIVVKLNKVTSV